MPASSTSAPASWSAWETLPDFPALSPTTLAELLDGGQAFRWHRTEAGTWLGQWSDNLAEIRLSSAASAHSAQNVEWRAPIPIAPLVAAALPRYLGATTDYPALIDALPWRSDAHLARCVDAFNGLRLLRQPFGETLLGFLCSATKQIVQIKQMMELLARRHGAALPLPLPSGLPLPPPDRSTLTPQLSTSTSAPPLPSPDPSTLTSQLSTSSPSPPAPHRLPTWPELAAVPEKTLRACLLGFRARYIHGTALFLAAHPGWMEETETLPYPEAKARLRTLPGVGEKVADCVLLFGAGRLEAFPVDVWILKTLESRYGLAGWKPAQVAQFGRAHFGPAAGLAQQFLFAYERAAKKTARSASAPSRRPLPSDR